MRLTSYLAGPLIAALATVASLLIAPASVAAATALYEAEDAPAVCDGTIDTDHAGYSGTGFCNTPNTSGSYTQFTVTADSAGEATVEIGFANGSSGGARGADVLVNGTTVDSVTFETTGSWATWATKTLTVPLNAGDNTVRLVATGSGGLPNIDYLNVEQADGGDGGGGPAVRYEAEDAPAVCDGSIDTDHAGYSGTGFCNTPNTSGSYSQFTVEAAEAGDETAQVRFANGSSGGARGADVLVNGTTVDSVSFETTGSWDIWGIKILTVPLNAGDNTVRLVATGSGGLPNIDYLETGEPDDDPGGSLEGCSGTAPIHCHYDVPTGNYNVTAVLGGSTAGSTVVTAETRRTMLAGTSTATGQQLTEHFTINVRDPEAQPTGQGGSTGGPGLDVYFDGPAPRLSGVTVTAASPQQLFIAGDSTTCDQFWAPYTGWGQELTQFFGQGLSVANYADSGEGSVSFVHKSVLFPAMRPLIRGGDVVLIQFGHNDKRTSSSDFRYYLTTMIEGVRDQGGTPVLVTPIVRRRFNSDGTLNNGAALHVNELGVNLPAEMRQLAQEKGVALIDMTALTKQLVESLGTEGSKAIYLTNEEGDNTHLSEHGATEYAELVRDELRSQGLLDSGLFR